METTFEDVVLHAQSGKVPAPAGGHAAGPDSNLILQRVAKARKICFS